MAQQWVPALKEELFSAIAREWDLLLKLRDHLSEEPMTTSDSGGWSPKDNLAHITEGMQILPGYHFDKRPGHEVPGGSEDVTKAWEMDTIDAVLLSTTRFVQAGM